MPNNNYDPFFNDEPLEHIDLSEQNQPTDSDPAQMEKHTTDLLNNHSQNSLDMNGAENHVPNDGDQQLNENARPSFLDNNSFAESKDVAQSITNSSSTSQDKDVGEHSSFDKNCNPNSSNGGYYSYSNGMRTKKRAGIGLMLLIMIPILIITNIATSLLVFDKVWTEAKTEFEIKLNDYVLKGNPTGTPSTYNISKQEMPSVVSINSSSSNVSSSGTGFVISTDGYILTNAHVVTSSLLPFPGVNNTQKKVNEKNVAIFEGNKTEYKLKVIAYDSVLDLAVLKMVDVLPNLRAVTFGDSTLLEFGEQCVAIGNAKGFGLSVTDGIVSSPIQYHVLASTTVLTAAIQHTAPINPGNSGGPLFDIRGRVIGVNTFKMKNPDPEIPVDGMGYAIPSSVVKDYVNGLKINGLLISYADSSKTK